MRRAYDERYRPQYHFSPPRNWMNDPHGLVWHEGEYHLFYQHNAKDTRWGPMSWGNTVSADMLHWRHLPIAISPDAIGGIWTGCVVSDSANTSGLLPGGGLVAIYSYEDQSVGLAYSADRGRNWTSYQANPIIPSPGGNFRDPQVLWHEGCQRWLMAISRERAVQFFDSLDLRRWTPTGEFSVPASDDAPWEMPDIFPLGEGDARRWVMLVSMSGAPAGGLGIRYFIGDFDGRAFRSELPDEMECWLDYGPDNYAGATWKYEPSGRRLYIGWLNNWRYAEATPTQGWRGALTVPRELRLVETGTGPRLRQEPLVELACLRGEARHWEAQPIEEVTNLLDRIRSSHCEMQLELVPQTAAAVCIRVHMGATGGIDICYNAQEGKLLVDRTHSGRTDFHEDFAAVASAPLDLRGEPLRLRVFIDRSSVEVFANEGRVVLSSRVFPGDDWDGMALFTCGGAAWLQSLTIWPLQSIWREVG